MAHMFKLWRVLIFPRTVFDELREKLHTRLPLGMLLASVFTSALAICFLAPIPVPSAEEVEEYRIKRTLQHLEDLEAGIDRKQRDKRAQELREEYYGPQDIPVAIRVGAYPWDPVLKPFAVMCLLIFMATSYKLVTKLVESDISWEEWFGFSCWALVPFIFDCALDVVYAAMNMHRQYLIYWNLGAGYFNMTTTSILGFWTLFIEVQGLRSWTSQGVLACLGLVLLAFLLTFPPLALLLFFLLSVQTALIL